MTVALLESLVRNLLEDEHLVGASLIIHYCCLYDCTLHERCADKVLTLVVEEKDLVELHIGAFGLRKSLNEDLVASLHFELLACNFYDCEHY